MSNITTNKEQEIKACIKWFKNRGIEAYNDSEDVYLICDQDEIHVLISPAEIEYRAELQSMEED